MTDKIDDLISSVDGGVAQSICEMVRDQLDIELEDLPQTDLDRIDEAIFTCELCGWTMPTDDESEEDGICRECQEDEE